MLKRVHSSKFQAKEQLGYKLHFLNLSRCLLWAHAVFIVETTVSRGQRSKVVNQELDSEFNG